MGKKFRELINRKLADKRRVRLSNIIETGRWVAEEIQKEEIRRKSLLQDMPKRVTAEEVFEGKKSVYELCAYENRVTARATNKAKLNILRQFQGYVNAILGQKFAALQKEEGFKKVHKIKKL